MYLLLLALAASAAPSARMERGVQFMQRGNYRGAERLFRQALEERPDLPVRSVMLGRVLLARNRCQEGEALVLSQRSRKAYDLAAASAVAACRARVGDFGEAVYWQEDAVGLAPWDTRALSRLAIYRFKAGDLPGAQDALAAAADIDPESLPVLLAGANLALARGDVAGVDRALGEIDRLWPNSNPLRYVIDARLEMDLGDPVGAIPMVRKALFFGLNQASAEALLAEALRRTGARSEARGVLQRRRVSEEEQRQVRVVSARLLVDEGEVDQAWKRVEDLLRADDLSPEILATAWYVAMAGGRTADAAEFESRYQLARTSPLRELELLYPISSKD